MKKNRKLILFIIILVALIALTVFLYVKRLEMYTIFFATLSAVVFLGIVIYAFDTKDEKSIYLSNLNKVLKSYDAVLVDSENLPELRGKNILMVTNISDMIDAQIEIRKPIYYKRELDSCAFVIIDGKEACVYIMKLNSSVVSPLEVRINELVKESVQKKNKKSVLSEIEKTTIIKLDNMKSYKVSPIKKGVSEMPTPKTSEKSILSRLREDFLPKLKDK